MKFKFKADQILDIKDNGNIIYSFYNSKTLFHQKILNIKSEKADYMIKRKNIIIFTEKCYFLKIKINNLL